MLLRYLKYFYFRCKWHGFYNIKSPITFFKEEREKTLWVQAAKDCKSRHKLLKSGLNFDYRQTINYKGNK